MSEAKDVKTESGVALWNPNAAANWSLLFTPVFGAYLHALNWQALGEHERASGSMKWVYTGIGLLIINLLFRIQVTDHETVDGISRIVGFAFLLSWYFSSAKAQVKYVKQKYNTPFPRKPWGKPLSIAIGCWVGVLVLAVLVKVLLAMLGRI